MEKNQRIIIDTLGSDLGPKTVLEGAKMVLEQYPNIHLVLVGDESLIDSFNFPKERISVINSNSTITNNDDILSSFYESPNASILLAIKELKESDAIGLITPGNSGAIMFGAAKYLRNKDLDRPCLGAILPTINNQYVCLVDVGANVDCNANHLNHFAHLGSNFMKSLYQIEKPKVGLISIGTEPNKGNQVIKEAHQLLNKDKGINFIGNVESNKLLSGDFDVAIADGFVANQILKTIEGISNNIINEIKSLINNDNKEEFLNLLKHLKNKYDLSNLGGGILLGASKYVIKCRGNSNELAILNAAKMLINLNNNNKVYN